MISTHILDTTRGAPAEGVPVALMKQVKNEWVAVSNGVTDSDGRFKFASENEAGIYQILFSVEKYLASKNPEFFFNTIPVVFTITQIHRKYHVPLLLNPFGYSTYRGS